MIWGELHFDNRFSKNFDFKWACVVLIDSVKILRVSEAVSLHDMKLWIDELIACKPMRCVNLNCERTTDSKLLILHDSLNVEYMHDMEMIKAMLLNFYFSYWSKYPSCISKWRNPLHPLEPNMNEFVIEPWAEWNYYCAYLTLGCRWALS